MTRIAGIVFAALVLTIAALSGPAAAARQLMDVNVNTAGGCGRSDGPAMAAGPVRSPYFQLPCSPYAYPAAPMPQPDACPASMPSCISPRMAAQGLHFS